MLTRSPVARKRGGLKPAPTPDGVPVAMTSPGWSVIPAEIVASIAVGEVRLTIPGDEAASLEDMQAEVEEEILPEGSTWYQRLAWWTTGRNR